MKKRQRKKNFKQLCALMMEALEANINIPNNCIPQPLDPVLGFNR